MKIGVTTLPPSNMASDNATKVRPLPKSSVEQTSIAPELLGCGFEQPDLTELGELGKLPNELVHQVVDYLAGQPIQPRALASFAQTSKCATQFVNDVLERLVLVPKAYHTTSSRLYEWTAQLHTLSPEMRRALKQTADLLPPPPIFEEIGADTQEVYVNIGIARDRAQAGDDRAMEIALAHAAQAALRTGIEIPDMSVIERDGYENSVHVNIAKARSHAQADDYISVYIYLSVATIAAEKGGVEAPDTEMDKIRDMVRDVDPLTVIFDRRHVDLRL